MAFKRRGRHLTPISFFSPHTAPLGNSFDPRYRGLMADPYTIRIYVPDGDPEGVRIVDRMNRKGVGLAFPRSRWLDTRQRPELARTGVYLLVGYREGASDDLPTIYVGKGAREVRTRIDSHYRNKDFWDTGVVFTSSGGDLNAAHVEWLEHALIERAALAERCHLDNDTAPQESPLSEAEKADTREFLKEILQILPLLGIHSLEIPKAVVLAGPAVDSESPKATRDTVIVPANEEGFKRVFLGEDCWFAIRISGGMLPRIRYIAAYQTAPIGAITHYAEVDRIEPYGDDGKYKLFFKGKAKELGPIPYADAPRGTMQGPRYATFANLRKAKKWTDLI